jgi:hypothetical protein
MFDSSLVSSKDDSSITEYVLFGMPCQFILILAANFACILAYKSQPSKTYLSLPLRNSASIVLTSQLRSYCTNNEGLTLLQQFNFSVYRHVCARPAGKRCLVMSSNGITISRLRNGTILHRFPSALPNGSKRGISGPASSYSILDCIFHEVAMQRFFIGALAA